jgi:hypothetical protein
MATKALETRRGFLNALLTVAGGATAAAFAGIGCSAPASTISDRRPLPAAGATEVLPLSAGNRYANVMPDRIAAVRLRHDPALAADWSTSKAYE